MKKIELILSNTFIFKGRVFERGRTYGVAPADADHLLMQRNERDMPYFRMTEDGEPVLPTNKVGKQPVPAPENPPEADEQNEEDQLTPAQKAARTRAKKKAKKKAAAKAAKKGDEEDNDSGGVEV